MHTDFRVLLVGNYPHDNQESMQRFSALMAQGLERRGVAVELVTPEPVMGRLHRSASGLGKWLGYFDKFVLFPRTLRRMVRAGHHSRPVIVHVCDHSNSPFIAHLGKQPHVVTVHDLFAVRSALGEFAKNPTRWSGRILQSMILRGLKRCQYAVCVSEATREDLLRVTAKSSCKVGKVLLGLNYPYARMNKADAEIVLQRIFTRLKASVPRTFILHVGGDSWYKNRNGVLQIYGALKSGNSQEQAELVMAGAVPGRDLQSVSRELNIEARVHWTGKVSNEELQALYNRAEALVFPSLVEGFGWPPLEAQACGCLVVSSNRASLPEVVGDGGLFIDAEDPNNGAQVLAQLLSMSLAEREKLRERGFGNVRRFSVEQMIDGYLEIYQQLAAEGA